MNALRVLWLLLPRRVRELPADLAAMGGIVLLTNVAVFAPILQETPVRVPLGLAFVLFVPGYALIAALFPEQGDSPAAGESENEQLAGAVGLSSGIDGVERTALSFGLSIAVVPLIGLVLNFTPWGIRLEPIMIAVSGFTLIALGVADHRRRQLPADERFVVPYRRWLQAGRAELFEPDTRVDAALNVLLAVSVLLAVGSVAYAVAVPPQGETFSELYILTEDEDGELVASGYPTEFVRGESRELVVGVENNEHGTASYSMIVAEQRVERTDDDNATVVEQRELQRFQTELAHNGTWNHRHEISPTIVGNSTRLVWLLYVDEEVPDTPTRENASYSVHLWVTVDDATTSPS